MMINMMQSVEKNVAIGNEAVITVRQSVENTSQTAQVRAEDLQKIYEIVMDNFPVEEAHATAAVASCLQKHGIDKKSLGISKMLYAFQEMSDFLTMDESHNFCMLRRNASYEARRTACDTAVTNSTKKEPSSRQERTRAPKTAGKSRNGEFVYASLCNVRTGKNGNRYYVFRTVDGFGFSLSESMKERFLPDLVIGEYAWFRIVNEEEKRVFFQGENPRNIPAEAAAFERFCKVGDVISRPVTVANLRYLQIALGPTLFTRILRNPEDTDVDYSSLKKGEIYRFEIMSIEKPQGKLRVGLKPVGRYTNAGRARNMEVLPESMKDIVYREETMKRIMQTEQLKEVLDQILSGDPSKVVEELSSYIDRKYLEQKEEGTLVVTRYRGQFRIDVDLELKDRYGVPMKAMVNRNYGFKNLQLSQIGCAEPGKEMERFVYVPNWNKVTKILAELALPEKWDYCGSNDCKRPVLRQYLRFTFYKARLDGQVFEVGDKAIFNTGLVDRSYDDIYCYLRKNDDMSDPYGRKWTIGYFACKSKGREGKELNRLFTEFPPAPSYIQRDRLDTVFLDTEKEWEPDYQHIIRERMERLPRSFVKRALSFDRELVRLVDSGAGMKDIQKYVNQHDTLVRQLQGQLQFAKETAIKYCRWNYKTAIPMYYPRINNISLLLPLNLSGDADGRADVALVVEQLPNGNYQGQTILSLDMAYQDARQICRPNSEWLTLDLIEGGDNKQNQETDANMQEIC